MNNLREICDKAVKESISEVMPEDVVKAGLANFEPPEGRLYMVAIGKAAFRMAKCALAVIDAKGGHLDGGIVITKYAHALGSLPGIEIYEAGHPISDENGYRATKRTLELTKDLSQKDTVLFLVSGGGSALFELSPLLPDTLRSINEKLLICGANINEVNAVRKGLSLVKGGRFAEYVYPASIYSVILSDVLGDDVSTIASGPSVANDEDAKEKMASVLVKYNLSLPPEVHELLERTPVTKLTNSTYYVSGSVKTLCVAMSKALQRQGFITQIITTDMTQEARNAGKEIGRRAKQIHAGEAYIFGGETVVKVKGKGLGGRNQELVLSAAGEIEGIENVAVFSFGSDGTDGPTDAAGGYADYSTARLLKEKGIDIEKVLDDNDSYNALLAVDGLIVTGPTGTNVNDVCVLFRK